MAWTIEITNSAKRELAKFYPQHARRILKFLSERVAPLEAPRSIDEALKGSTLGEFWKYLVGEYRIISSIEDGQLKILVARIGNRREVHR